MTVSSPPLTSVLFRVDKSNVHCTAMFHIKQDDSQAVDRCYRIGQRKDVVVYRFITAGTVEGELSLFFLFNFNANIILN